jgi:hypothetical protein
MSYEPEAGDRMNPSSVAVSFELVVQSARPFGDGLIHQTWLVETDRGPHLLQRLNEAVFHDPEAVAENAAEAATQLVASSGMGLEFLRDSRGRPWTRDDDGRVWRASVFIPDSRPALPEEAREAACLLGRFPRQVAGADLPDPSRILPGFHDTEARRATFEIALLKDSHDRFTNCRPEVDRVGELATLAEVLAPENLPSRLVHNDAKLDNVLVDIATGRGLCVIDLDTVMPGLAAHDFGDLVRSTVTGRPEDEPDTSTITIREDLFGELAAGYLEGAADWITAEERASLVTGALVITYEQALRFLTDYLVEDAYYKVTDPEHNLRRTRAQLRLLDLLLESEDRLRKHIPDD